ncbi:MAG: PilX N-terminal domain-containing pilus assembly protein [Gemmatimonadota bacterium]
MPRIGHRGAILPIVLLVLLALSALGTGAFLAASFERRISEAHRAGVIALYVAESGLAHLLAENPPSFPALRSYAFPDGDAVVRADRLVTIDSTRALVLVTSRGTHGVGRQAIGVRSVQIVAEFGAGPPRPRRGSWHERW